MRAAQESGRVKRASLPELRPAHVRPADKPRPVGGDTKSEASGTMASPKCRLTKVSLLIITLLGKTEYPIDNTEYSSLSR
jgi:hypothetical protein